MLKYITLIEILFFAAWSDIKFRKVSNFLILLGLGFGLIFEIQESNYMGIIKFILNISYPIIILYLFFLMHALGAGDVKLFSVISSFFGLKAVTICIIYSIFIGGFFSIIKIVRYRKLIPFLTFYLYAKDSLLTRKILPYTYVRSDENTICFSVPILLSCLIYIGGVSF